MHARTTRHRSALTLIAALWAGAANAAAHSDPATLLDDMRAAMVAGEVDEAIAMAKQTRKVLKASGEPVTAHVQAGLALVEGAARWSVDDQDDAMEAWRTALRLIPELTWDPDLPAVNDADAVFEALRREVRGRAKTVVGVPADLGATQLYVAGQPATPDMALPEGSYLVQAACPDGELRSRWWRSDKPLKAEKSCPGGLGESQAVVDEGCDEVEFDAFGNPVDACASGGLAQGD